MPFDEGKIKKYKLKKTKRKAKYQPSIIGVTYKIKGKKPKIMSGISVRPILM